MANDVFVDRHCKYTLLLQQAYGVGYTALEYTFGLTVLGLNVTSELVVSGAARHAEYSGTTQSQALKGGLVCPSASQAVCSSGASPSPSY